MKTEETGTLQRKSFATAAGEPLPGLLVAHAPAGAKAPSHRAVDTGWKVTVGRSEGCDLRISENSVSRLHLAVKVNRETGEATLADGGSKNGTFVNGTAAEGMVAIEDGAVIRAGRAVLVYCADIKPMLLQRPEGHDHLVGRFHAKALLAELNDAACSGRNVLLAGPSGSGKELAAQALARMGDRELLAHNAARFSSQEEATTTLFGVTKGAFTAVDDRPGLIERANGGALFLDEAHVLPERVQKSLLRVVEDGKVARFGQTQEKEVDVRFVLATNEPAPTYGLAHDLLNRLMVVNVPALSERVADIPGIFDHLLKRAFEKAGLDSPAEDMIDADHYEALMIDGFEKDNVRGLKDIADRIAAKINTGANPHEAVDQVFARRFGNTRVKEEAETYRRQNRQTVGAQHAAPFSPGAQSEGAACCAPTTGIGQVTRELPLQTHYPTEEHRNVHEAYIRVGNNAAAIERDLKARGMKISSRKIRKLMDELLIPRVRRG